jgi:hypothetical protein
VVWLDLVKPVFCRHDHEPAIAAGNRVGHRQPGRLELARDAFRADAVHAVLPAVGGLSGFLARRGEVHHDQSSA